MGHNWAANNGHSARELSERGWIVSEHRVEEATYSTFVAQVQGLKNPKRVWVPEHARDSYLAGRYQVPLSDGSVTEVSGSSKARDPRDVLREHIERLGPVGQADDDGPVDDAHLDNGAVSQGHDEAMSAEKAAVAEAIAAIDDSWHPFRDEYNQSDDDDLDDWPMDDGPIDDKPSGGSLNGTSANGAAQVDTGAVYTSGKAHEPPVLPNDMVNPEVGMSRFTNVEDLGQPTETITLRTLLEIVGSDRHKAAISAAREKVKEMRAELTKAEQSRDDTFIAAKKAEYQHAKRGLPAVSPSGIFMDRRKEDTEFIHTGLVVIDIDFDQTVQMGKSPNEIKDLLMARPYVVSAFLSPSGEGVKAIARIRMGVKTEDDHWRAFTAVELDLEANGILIDTKGRDNTRLSFESWDDELRVNWNADAHSWEGFQVPVDKKRQKVSQVEYVWVDDSSLVDAFDKVINKALAELEKKDYSAYPSDLLTQARQTDRTAAMAEAIQRELERLYPRAKLAQIGNLIVNGHRADVEDVYQPDNPMDRSSWAFKVYLRLFHAGVTLDQAMAMAKDPRFDINESMQDDSKHNVDRETERTILNAYRAYDHAAKTQAQKDPVLKLIEEWWPKYMVVENYGGKPIVGLLSKTGEVTPVLLKDFEASKRRFTVPIGDKDVNAGKVYIDSLASRHYITMGFRPDRPPGEYYEDGDLHWNTYMGPDIEPVEGDVSKAVNWLRDNVAGGDEAMFRAIWQWLAHLVQYPWMPARVAIVLRGAQKIGKTFFAETFLKLLAGAHHTRKENDPMGRFNGHTERTIVQYSDEEKFRAAEQGRIRDMVTQDERSIEQKGFKQYVITNFLRIVLLSNSDFLLDLSGGFRRFLMPDMIAPDAGADGQGVNRFYADLARWLEHEGGAAALLYALKNEPNVPMRLPDAIESASIRSQREQSLNLVARWWHDYLVAGGWAEQNTVGFFHDLYVDYAQLHKRRWEQIFDRTRFSKEMRKLATFETRRVNEKGHGKVRQWVFGSREEAVAEFKASTGTNPEELDL